MKLKRSLLAAATLVVAAAGVQPAAAIKQGDWLVRGRLAAVVPLDDSGVVNVGGAPLAGSGVEVDTGFTLDIDFTYMFTNNIGAELLLDVTSKHDIDSTGTLAGVAPGTILTARALPPALILQYHFMPKQRFSPYVGAGLNYTIFYNEDAPGGAVTSIHYKDTWGYGLQTALLRDRMAPDNLDTFSEAERVAFSRSVFAEAASWWWGWFLFTIFVVAIYRRLKIGKTWNELLAKPVISGDA